MEHRRCRRRRLKAELEVVVENSEGAGTKARPNAMALRAELSGTAVRQLDER